MRSPFPHCYRSKDRYGRERWLLRVPGRKAVTIKGRYGSPEFAENYRNALAPIEKRGLGTPRHGTMLGLISHQRILRDWQQRLRDIDAAPSNRSLRNSAMIESTLYKANTLGK